MVGHCGPYHDPGSRWSRWGCEVEVRCKGIVYFIHCDGWSLYTLILVPAGVDEVVKWRFDVKV